ncbi:MAG TPA: FAD-dependent oxidoreductase [Candidatus Saccharimonadia bacterium]|nr:FAD-dependent oxidoreductase [Candidatus Saccharimonadia bacterium]
MSKHKVVIIGGGFAGIKSALLLSKNPKFHVQLISDHMDFNYFPTLFQTATGKNKALSNIPLEQIFKKRPIDLIQDQVKTLDRKNKCVTTAKKRKFSYDTLLIGLGVKTNYFNIKGLEEYSYGIKSLDDAERFKNHLHKQIYNDKKPDLNYVVVGGGPTGVELAAMLPSYISKILKYHSIKETSLHIDLIEAAPRILPKAPEDLSIRVEKHLKKLDINIYTNTAVESESSGVLLANNKPIHSHSVVWTAGVTNNNFFLDNEFELSKNGRVIVDKHLQAEKGIYVMGDNADTPFSGMAQTAIYDGKFVSNNLERILDNKKPSPYIPKTPIYVFNVGPNWAAVLWGPLKIYGLLGSWLRGLADIAGFHDYEPWNMAIMQAGREFEEEESCPVCKNKV